MEFAWGDVVGGCGSVVLLVGYSDHTGVVARCQRVPFALHAETVAGYVFNFTFIAM